MNLRFFCCFIWVTTVFFSQKKISKAFQTTSKEINIYTAGLDNLQIENSETDFVTVYLEAENYDEQLIDAVDTGKKVDIKFNFEGTETREVVFRKFITKRLQRANTIVKIPNNIKVYVFGENVDIESKSIKNKLAIYIENGIVKLNTIHANTSLSLYSGNVYASTKSAIVDIQSKNGKITVNKIPQKETYQQIPKYAKSKFKVNTIKGNIFLVKE